MDESNKYVDVEALLGPRLLKKIPRFAINYLKKIVHQDDLNAAIKANPDVIGTDFLRVALDTLDIHANVRGIENLPHDGLYIFACNHPLGGPEALIIGDVISQHYGANLKFIVNSLLTEMKPLAPLFLPVKIGGKQTRAISEQMKQLFASDNQICIFPAGICARKINGQVTEMPWKKMFIGRARKSHRDIIPVHCTGENSRRFYLLAKIGQLLHLKFNIAMLYLVDELYKKQHQTFTVTFGKPIPWQSLDKTKTDIEWAADIRQNVMNLAPQSEQTP
ncbi:MAG: 1-acyl-sn-glycerol-3-phosphate acyltransferase [Paludibacteraceae bacterium]